MSTRLEWAVAIQKGVGVDPYQDGNIALVNIMVAEGGSAKDNPVNTIEPEPGATPFNTFDGGLHVENYTSMDEGISAIVATLNGADNAEVLTALREHKDCEIVTALVSTHSSWSGAGKLYIDTLPRTIADFSTLGAVEVAGPAPEPVPSPAPAPVEPVPPVADPTTEVEKTEDAVATQTDEVDAAAAEGKASRVRELVAALKTHLAELEDLTK